MEYTSFRERESNFIVRFLADAGVKFAGYLFEKCIPYAIMYKVNWDEEDEQVEEKD